MRLSSSLAFLCGSASFGGEAVPPVPAYHPHLIGRWEGVSSFVDGIEPGHSRHDTFSILIDITKDKGSELLARVVFGDAPAPNCHITLQDEGEIHFYRGSETEHAPWHSTPVCDSGGRIDLTPNADGTLAYTWFKGEEETYYDNVAVLRRVDV